jgi:hypothetical protein
MKKSALLLPLLVVSTSALADKPAKGIGGRDPDAVRCIKTPVTGSIVRKTKICRTNAEWQKFQEREKAESDEFLERNRASNPTPSTM